MVPLLVCEPPPTPAALLQADNNAEPDPSMTPAVPAFLRKSRRLGCAWDPPAGWGLGDETVLRLKTTSSHRFVALPLACRERSLPRLAACPAGGRARAVTPRSPRAGAGRRPGTGFPWLRGWCGRRTGSQASGLVPRVTAPRPCAGRRRARARGGGCAITSSSVRGHWAMRPPGHIAGRARCDACRVMTSMVRPRIIAGNGCAHERWKIFTSRPSRGGVARERGRSESAGESLDRHPQAAEHLPIGLCAPAHRP